MKTLIASSIIAVAVAAPSFAQSVQDQGYASDAARLIFQQELARSDDGNDRLIAREINAVASADLTAVLSSSGQIDPRAQDIFLGLAAEDGNYDAIAAAKVIPTVASGDVVDARAAAVFAALSDED